MTYLDDLVANELLATYAKVLCAITDKNALIVFLKVLNQLLFIYDEGRNQLYYKGLSVKLPTKLSL